MAKKETETSPSPTSKGAPSGKKFTTKAKTPDGILKATARLLHERGWRQGLNHKDPDGPICMMLALGIVTNHEEALHTPAYNLLRIRLGLPEIEAGAPWPLPRVGDWNDDPSRTEAQVFAVLEGAPA